MALLGLENNFHFSLQAICAYIKAFFSKKKDLFVLFEQWNRDFMMNVTIKY